MISAFLNGADTDWFSTLQLFVASSSFWILLKRFGGCEAILFRRRRIEDRSTKSSVFARDSVSTNKTRKRETASPRTRESHERKKAHGHGAARPTPQRYSTLLSLSLSFSLSFSYSLFPSLLRWSHVSFSKVTANGFGVFYTRPLHEIARACLRVWSCSYALVW